MRQDCANWCNPRNSGAGVPSTAKTANKTLVDAYFWLKTPGESDGCSETLPDGSKCARFDSMCGSVDSIGTTGNEPRAPEAGAWFDYQVKQLASNANFKPPKHSTTSSICNADLSNSVQLNTDVSGPSVARVSRISRGPILYGGSFLGVVVLASLGAFGWQWFKARSRAAYNELQVTPGVMSRSPEPSIGA